jgi:hypothetical protein
MEGEELEKYRLSLVEVDEVRYCKACTEPAKGFTLFYGKGNENHQLWMEFPKIT